MKAPSTGPMVAALSGLSRAVTAAQSVQLSSRIYPSASHHRGVCLFCVSREGGARGHLVGVEDKFEGLAGHRVQRDRHDWHRAGGHRQSAWY